MSLLLFFTLCSAHMDNTEYFNLHPYLLLCVHIFGQTLYKLTQLLYHVSDIFVQIK